MSSDADWPWLAPAFFMFSSKNFGNGIPECNSLFQHAAGCAQRLGVSLLINHAGTRVEPTRHRRVSISIDRDVPLQVPEKPAEGGRAARQGLRRCESRNGGLKHLR